MAGSDNSDSWLWIIGVVLVLLGSLGQNFGNNLVSLSHSIKTKVSQDEVQRKLTFDEERQKVRESGLPETADVEQSSQGGLTVKAELDRIDREEKEVAKPSERHGTMWYTGTTIFITASFLTFAAFGFAAQSLLASLESIQFVSNVLFAKYVHGEEITLRMIISTLGIVGGNCLVVVFSTHSSALLQSQQIINLWLYNTNFTGYLVASFVLWCVAEFTFVRYHDARVKHNKRYWKHGMVEPMAYVISSAIIGAVAVIKAKCLSMLIQVSVRGIQDEFSRATLWVILVVWLGVVGYWLRRLDWGLELFPPLFFIPVIQVAFITFAIVAGGIFYQEFDIFTWQQWIGFSFGVFMILSGVYGLAPTDIDALSVGLVLPIDYEPEATSNTTAENGRAVSPELLETPQHKSKLDELAALDTLDRMPPGALLDAPAELAERGKPGGGNNMFFQSLTAAATDGGEDAGLQAPAGPGDEAMPDDGVDNATPGGKKRRVVKHGSATPV